MIQTQNGSRFRKKIAKEPQRVTSVSRANELGTNTQHVPWLIVHLLRRRLRHVLQASVPRRRLRLSLDGLEDGPSTLPPHGVTGRAPHDIDRLNRLPGTVFRSASTLFSRLGWTGP